MDNEQRKLKLLPTITLLVAGMIGSAIFSMSGLTISYAGPASIISWILAAILQLGYGLAVAELATTYKKNGGGYIFPELTFGGEKGKILGFLSTWGVIFADIISVAFGAMSMSLYLIELVPSLSDYGLIISIASILFCLLLNMVRFTITGNVNLVFAVLLVVILCIYSLFAIFNGDFQMHRLVPFFSQGVKGSFGFLSATPIAMIAYSSIISVGYMFDEIENPKKNIPLATVVSLFIVVGLYVFTIFATVTNITVEDLNKSPEYIYTPLITVINTKLQNAEVLKNIVLVGILIALISTNVVVMAMFGRLLKAVSDDMLLPKILGKDGKNGTPIYAMGALSVVASIFVMFPNIVEILLNMGAIFIVISITINLYSFIYTRKYNKGIEDHYRAPLKTFMVVMIFLIFIACYMNDIIKGGGALLIITISWYATGICVYLYFRSKNKKLVNKM